MSNIFSDFHDATFIPRTDESKAVESMEPTIQTSSLALVFSTAIVTPHRYLNASYEEGAVCLTFS